MLERFQDLETKAQKIFSPGRGIKEEQGILFTLTQDQINNPDIPTREQLITKVNDLVQTGIQIIESLQVIEKP